MREVGVGGTASGEEEVKRPASGRGRAAPLYTAEAALPQQAAFPEWLLFCVVFFTREISVWP